MEHTNELINVTIWGKDGCHHCMNAKIYCETHDLSFDYKLVNKDFTLAELKEKLPSVKTYPVIQINGKWVGGYYDLIKRHKELVGADGS